MKKVLNQKSVHKLKDLESFKTIEGFYMKEIFARVSVRKFLEKPVEKEKIEKILRAAMAAPTAGNQQEWEFIVVENKDNLQKLSTFSPYSKSLAEAPIAIVLLSNKDKLRYPENWQQDLGAAAQNMLLEAVHLGLGSVWLGVAPLEDRMKFIADFFNLSDNLQPFAVLPFGYPSGEHKPKDRFDPSKIRWNR